MRVDLELGFEMACFLKRLGQPVEEARIIDE
jgi:hypothetical protein